VDRYVIGFRRAVIFSAKPGRCDVRSKRRFAIPTSIAQ
jgi:hypothetical protein